MKWLTRTPPTNKKIHLLCVLFDLDDYRTLEKKSYGYNRVILEGVFNGKIFVGNYHHDNGNPFYQVVAWSEDELDKENYGSKYYPKCLGECIGENTVGIWKLRGLL